MGSVAIAHNDSIIYSKAVGYSDAAKKKDNEKNTKFRIGSVTKTYTAVLILKAIEERKLKLDDKLVTFYPTIANANKITIEELLKHRSGVFNFTEIEGEGAWEEHFHTEQEFVDYLAKQKSNFEPGSDYEYSNSNYALLGFILQKIYKQPFAAVLVEKICKPLNLLNTYYTFEVDTAKNEALSYNIQDTYLKNGNVNFSNHPASGGIVSTPTDVNRFLFALFNKQLITTQSLEAMLPVDKGAYGFGIEKLKFDNPMGYAHGGRVENYFSNYWYFPKENVGVVVLANAVNIDVDVISTALLKSAYGTMPELPNFNHISNMADTEFNEIKGTYFSKDQKESITISSDGKYLVFQNSRPGQDYVYFEYKGNQEFQYDSIALQFFPDKHEMMLKQGAEQLFYRKSVKK